MSDELHEFSDVEEQLRRMPLRRPSPMLDERVRRVIRPRWGLALGVAAAMALLAGTGAVLVREMGRHDSIGVGQSAREVAREQIEVGEIERPIVVAQSIAGTPDGNVIGSDADGTFRRVRRTVVRQVRYVNPETGKTIWLTVPREEVVLMKVEAF
jgi:hypothetical protein